MGALSRGALVLALLLPAPAHADDIARWRPFVVEAATRFALPPTWIERVMRAESAGLTRLGGRPITSRAGAMGLMQLMPATWAVMRDRLSLGPDPHAPRDNILAGAGYFRLMYDLYGYPGCFAAYNAGPGRYAAYLGGRTALPRETRAYLAAVTDVAPAVPPAAAPDPHALFVAMSPVPRATPPAAHPLFFALTSPRP